MIRGKYLRERKANRIKFGTKIILCITIFLVLYRLVFNSFSLYESEANSEADIDAAFFILNDTYKSKVISLKDMIPGSRQEIEFQVSNFYNDENTHKDVIAETDIKYSLNIRATTNLPLEYEICIQDSTETGKPMKLTPVRDSFNTYFVNLASEEQIFTHEAPYTHRYKLIVTLPEKNFPGGAPTSAYQGTMECIEITVKGEQVTNKG